MPTGAELAGSDATLTRAEALDSLRTGVMLVDARACVLEMNPAAEQLLGIGRRAAVGRPLPDLLPHAQALLDLVQRALLTDGGFAHRALMLQGPGATPAAICDIEVTPLGGEARRSVIIELRDAEPALRFRRQLRLRGEL